MTRRPRIDDLAAVAVPEQPALSPDGGQAVYVLRTADLDADRDVRTLWRVGTGDGRIERLTHGPADTAPAWSPDGTRVAFLRAQGGPPQLWLLPAGGGEPERLTALPLGAGPPAWSPDGSSIAFAAAVDTEAADGEDAAARGRRAAAPVVIDRPSYQADGVGLIRGVRRHLHVLDLAGRRCRRLTRGDWNSGDPAWSPDGSRLAFTAEPGDGDPTMTLGRAVYLVDPAKPAEPPMLAGFAEGVAGSVTWTADGSALLVVGLPASTRMGHQGLWRLPAAGGAGEIGETGGAGEVGEVVDIADLAAPLDRNVMPGGPGYPGAPAQLAADGGTVLFCARDRGSTHLFAVPADGGPPRPLVTGAGRTVSGLSVVGDLAVVALSTPTSFGELVAVDLTTGGETVLTAHGADLAGVELFPRVEREFTVSDGTVVPGWVIGDPSVPGPRPLLLDIHGGPHNAWDGAADPAHLYHQELAARGWIVLLLNPRASDGYGERFFTAAVGGWGLADARDLLEPLDELVADGTADPDRLAVAGYSYGGYLTCYLTSRDDRFAAAVAGGVVSDLTSMIGTCDDGYHFGLLELGGAPWVDPHGYAAMSPLTRVADVRTPTLVLHGADDLTCPLGQAQQWYTALRARGVPTRLVVYPGARHVFILDGRPSHRLDYNRRIVDWVQRYAGERRPGPAPATAAPAIATPAIAATGR